MKIVKEEKGLYKFLKTVFDIQKSSKQKYIIGNYGYLYFYTPYRCGKFYQRSDKRIAMEYNFNDYSSYTLSQLPNGDFELRENDALSKEQMIDYMFKINNIIDKAYFNYAIDKDDICQLAKMTLITDRMLCDDDLKFFKRFGEAEVYSFEDYLLMNSRVVDDDLIISTTLLFNTAGHNVELQIQGAMFKKIVDEGKAIESIYNEEIEAQNIGEEPFIIEGVPIAYGEVENAVEGEINTDYEVEESLNEEVENSLEEEQAQDFENEEPF
ncbi:hypothetical protein [Faecalibacillus faecis]|uniref:hypothetical protein n=1 Tax=Faecalibacillus faecis TaxID=1982628 RepID=UPI0022E95244|nr:hypothetical protein [Faecalibacillus faecis]